MADLVRPSTLLCAELPLSEAHLAQLLAHHRVNERGVALVRTIRTTPSDRRRAGKAGNVTGWYPSRKMGFTVGYDSRTGELVYIVLCEIDGEVYEYFDHPTNLSLDYESASGLRLVHTYTPDFLVLSEAFAGFVEVKLVKELNKLVQKSPHRYQEVADGEFRSPPAEAAAAAYGLGFKIWTPSRDVQVLADNLRYLHASFASRPSALTQSRIDALREIVGSAPAITLESLIHQVEDPAEVYWCLYTGLLYADLKTVPLSHADRMRVFRTAGDEALWRAALESADRSDLRPDPEEMLRQAKLAQYPKEALRVALERYRLLRPIIEAGTNTEELARQKRSTCIRWLTRYREAKRRRGVGLLGLLPRAHLSGNRLQRFPPEVYDAMDAVALEEYETKRNVTVRTAHRALITRCEDSGLCVPSYGTFRRYLKERPHGSSVARRKGRKEAAAQAPPTGPRDPTVHGQGPLDVVHVDATKLDQWVVYGPPGEALVLRPWITVVLCAWSRVVIGYALSFDNPSVYTLFAALRDALERQRRVPNRFVVDWGSEFRSLDFETTCAAYGIEIAKRPPGRPRFGSVIERFFHTLNKQLIHVLSGNTQLLRDPRRMSREVDPACDAVWSLEDFDTLLRRYLFEEYPSIPHAGLGGMTPAERFKQGEETLAVGHPLPDSPDLRFLLWPYAKRRTAMVYRLRGMVVESVHYWNAVMSELPVDPREVEVRVDPCDAGHVVAYLQGVWRLCTALSYYDVFHGRSRRELRLSAAILRKRHRGEPGNSHVREKRLANLLRDIRGHEELARQRMRDAAHAAAGDRTGLKDWVRNQAADSSQQDQGADGSVRQSPQGDQGTDGSSDTAEPTSRLRKVPPGKPL